MTDAERTVSTLDEWIELASNDRAHPHVNASGELADRVRERFEAAPDTPVQVFYEYSVWDRCWVMTFECGQHRYQVAWSEFRRTRDLEYVRSWLDESIAAQRDSDQETA